MHAERLISKSPASWALTAIYPAASRTRLHHSVASRIVRSSCCVLVMLLAMLGGQRVLADESLRLPRTGPPEKTEQTAPAAASESTSSGETDHAPTAAKSDAPASGAANGDHSQASANGTAHDRSPPANADTAAHVGSPADTTVHDGSPPPHADTAAHAGSPVDNADGKPQTSRTDNGSVATFKVQLPPVVSVSESRVLSVEERVLLSKHDVVLVIDKSGSMFTPDCPQIDGAKGKLSAFLFNGYGSYGVSRWNWCLRQVLALGNQTDDLFPKGITVVVFSDGFTVYRGVHLKEIPMIFAHNQPSGGTRMAEPLNAVFADYFQRKAQDPNTKPLVVAIITDGMPNDPTQVEQTIAYAANHLQDQHELAVTILQIGPSCMGYATRLVEESKHFGARYHIVHTKIFMQLESVGLSRSLVDALTERQRF